MSLYKVRAVDFDNAKEVDALVSLFNESFGSSYSLQEHLDSNSLCTTCEGCGEAPAEFEDFVSVVVYHERKLVCHAAIYAPQKEGDACILFPAIHPDYAQCYDVLNKLIYEKILKIGWRQKWKRILLEVPLSKHKHRFSLKGFSKEVVPILKPLPSQNSLSLDIQVEIEKDLEPEEVFISDFVFDNETALI